jgi:Tfp pilus assembly protein PilF
MNKERAARLREFLDADPSDSFSRFALALEYINAGDTDSARGHFEYIREHDPGYVGLYYHLGKLYQSAGQDDLAEQTFRTGVRTADEAGDGHAAKELKEALAELHIEKH